MSDMEAKVGIEKPQPVPQNVKTPGQVQPETFPQEPTAAPQVEPTSRMRTLAGNEGVLQGREPLRLTEGMPEPTAATRAAKVEVMPPEAPVAKMGKPGRLGKLKAQGGTVVDTEPDLQQKIEEGLQGTAKPQATPPKGDLGRLKTPALPETNDKGQTLGFNFKPVEDIGNKVRAEQKGVPRTTERRAGERNAEADAMTEHFSAARKELGENASFEQIEARAKELKAGTPSKAEGAPVELTKPHDKELANAEINPEHIPISRDVLSSLTDKELAEHLNDNGVKTKGRSWDHEGEGRHRVTRDEDVMQAVNKMSAADLKDMSTAKESFDKKDTNIFDEASRNSTSKAARSREVLKEYNRLKSLREGTSGAEKGQGYGESNTGVT